MPEKKTVERAKRDLRQGKSPTTAAGEFVREEIEHVREGKHGVRSTKQAIAIGLSKARRAGVPLAPPRKGTASRATRKSARRDLQVGKGQRKPRAPSRKRSVATVKALKREPRSPVSRRALAQHARQAAARRKKRGATTRSPVRKAKRSTKRSSSRSSTKRSR